LGVDFKIVETQELTNDVPTGDVSMNDVQPMGNNVSTIDDGSINDVQPVENHVSTMDDLD